MRLSQAGLPHTPLYIALCRGPFKACRVRPHGAREPYRLCGAQPHTTTALWMRCSPAIEALGLRPHAVTARRVPSASAPSVGLAAGYTLSVREIDPH